MAPLLLTQTEVDAIPGGKSKCLKVDGTNVIVFKGADGAIKATLNKCKHFGGTFVPDVEDAGLMKCTFHGWKLDPSTMEYVKGSNPKILGAEMKQPEGTKQPQFIVAKTDKGYSLTYPEGENGGGGCEVC